MQITSLKTTLSVIFACIVLILFINYISKKPIENVTETDKFIDESTTENTEEDLETVITETNSESEIETEIESENETEIETKVEPVFYLSDYERWITECVVMGEAGAEPYEGQILVAQCLLNGCIKEGVQPSELRKKYKYSGWRDNPSNSVKNAVSAVFDDGCKITDEFILYFYAPKYSKGKWHETQRFVIEVGGHRFFAGWDN